MATGTLDEILPLLEETAGANPAIPSYWGAVARALCEVSRRERQVRCSMPHFPSDLRTFLRIASNFQGL